MENLNEEQCFKIPYSEKKKILTAIRIGIKANEALISARVRTQHSKERLKMFNDYMREVHDTVSKLEKISLLVPKVIEDFPYDT